MSRTTIYLHRADLVERRACAEGLALYDEFAAAQGRRRSLRIPLAGLLWAACDPCTRGFLVWAQSKGLLPRVSALGAELRGADLAGANLVGADLAGADLVGANLAGANLEGASLTRAYLTRADLRDANIRSADLRDAYLWDAYLGDADLTRADLTGARRWYDAPPIAGWTLRDGALVREVAA